MHNCLAKRIIPCLDVKDGNTVKGINFKDLQHAGDPIQLAKRYNTEGADELVFLDITATVEGRKTFTKLVSKIAMEINIPFAVGGGINSFEDVERLLDAGADKISINSAAINDPRIIDKITNAFGSQVCICAIDAQFDGTDWFCYIKGGREKTSLKLIDWAKEVEGRGAGEILFTSMNHDGMKNGYANEILAQMAEQLKIPIIASGGAGKKEDFLNVFNLGKADAALAASVFHFGEIKINDLKHYLSDNGIKVRILNNN